MKLDVSSLAHTKWECKYHIVFAMIFLITHLIILSTMMEMYLGIYLSLMVSMDYPFTTKPNRRNMKTATVPSFLPNSYRS